MHEAVDLGVPEVYIIHGLGEGKLRNTVQTILSELKSLGKLKSFSNEYLEKYGFGATWVKI
jgi:dsDNA-specific endonuclease/ATPase MutS2